MNATIDLKKQSDIRKERASALLNKAIPETVSEGVYLVPSSDGTSSHFCSLLQCILPLLKYPVL